MINDRSEDTPTSMDDFYYLNTTKQLNIEAWRPRQPNAKKPDQCLVTYLGLEPNASWSVISILLPQWNNLKYTSVYAGTTLIASRRTGSGQCARLASSPSPSLLRSATLLREGCAQEQSLTLSLRWSSSIWPEKYITLRKIIEITNELGFQNVNESCQPGILHDMSRNIWSTFWWTSRFK